MMFCSAVLDELERKVTGDPEEVIWRDVCRVDGELWHIFVRYAVSGGAG
jgi:hypothetical protein